MIPRSFLTATAETTDATITADANAENADETATEDTSATAETTDSTSAEDTGADITVEGDGAADISIEGEDLEDAMTITMDEEGNIVVVDPTTGEETVLTEEDLANLGLTTSTGANVEHKEITGSVTAIYSVYGIFCVILIVAILSQNKRSAAFGNGMSNGDTYWSKNKGRSKEGQLDFYTKCAIGIFIAATLLISLM